MISLLMIASFLFVCELAFDFVIFFSHTPESFTPFSERFHLLSAYLVRIELKHLSDRDLSHVLLDVKTLFVLVKCSHTLLWMP